MTIVITGATGNVGRPLVSELVRAGAAVRAMSRHPAAAGLPSEVEVVANASEALAGATAVFVNSRALGPGLAHFVARARSVGADKVVALSAINVEDAFSRQPSRFRGDRNLEAEQLAVGSGMTWVSLRPEVFNTNFAGMWAGQIRAGDSIAGPYAWASSAPIAEADISAVAARALLTDELDGQRVPLTGPQALTNVELVAALADMLGRPLRYVEVDRPVVRERLGAIGFPAEFADAYVAMQARAVEHPALVTHDVEKILGRPAQPFADWALQHIELFN
jgi:uncharacterized protein YbjT (DUF2867 family)